MTAGASEPVEPGGSSHTLARVTRGLAGVLEASAQAARTSGQLEFDHLPAVAIEIPKEKAHGDFASNLAMLLARPARKAPRAVAEKLVAELDKLQAAAGGAAGAVPGVPADPDAAFALAHLDRVEVAGPGFLNFHLRPGWLHAALAEILARGPAFGRSASVPGTRAMIEFVSANPTGPLSVPNARAAAFGDCLARVMAAAGHRVAREYYINDHGVQVQNLGRSLEARFRQEVLAEADFPFPEAGYPGAYLIELARAMGADPARAAEARRWLSLPDAECWDAFARAAVDHIVAGQRAALSAYGVEMDHWAGQRTYVESGAVAAALDELRLRGFLHDADGATWFASTRFGDDKDRVVIKGNGEYTYLASDVAYHRDKYQRGFDLLINIWGADHHGDIARLKGAMQALGYAPDRLEILIHQWVRLVRDGRPAGMSKRQGVILELTDLVDEVGVDAARFFFLSRSHEQHLDFDLGLAQRRSSDNPVYYVQYAHARICSIFRQLTEMAAEAGGSSAEEGGDAGAAEFAPAAEDLALLQHPAERELIRRLADLPEQVRLCAEKREPHHLPHYALEVATLFHAFYDSCRVLVDDSALRRARLALARGTQIVLANTLALLGVSAPERM